jgi:MinD-like ATPase involved in chromosome partitioning or flagellar assembly
MEKCLVISVISGKGGVGKTIISSNLAHIFSDEFKLKTLLIDANITNSHVFDIFKIPTNISLNRLLKGESAIFYRFGNLDILPSNAFPNEEDYTNINNLTKIVNELKKSYDVIVIDSAPGIGKETIVSIQASDLCLIVSTPFVLSVTDVLRIKEVLRYFEKSAMLVINMVEKKGYELKKSEIEYITDFPAFTLPYDEKVLEAFSFGELLSKYSPQSNFINSLKIIAKEIIKEVSLRKKKKAFWKELLSK